MSDIRDPGRESRRPERQLAAILAADVVGYSGLMERDEQGTHEKLKTLLRNVVLPSTERHRGRIVKTSGDGLIVAFSSAVEAVQCAVTVQQAMVEWNSTLSSDVRMAFRMGINLGDVLSDENDVFGDGVNIAARLEGLAEAGGLIVSHTVHEHVHGRLPFRFEDLGERSLKNIVRPIRVYRVGWQADRSTPQQPELPNRASIAVLPFTNMSSDPEQEYFADGLAEDLITDLSKIPGLLVIARNSSFAYKGKAADVRAVARELGVRYVIEGSVRRAASRVRINAQLIDANDHGHLWADRFDRDLSDIFLMQDEVVGKIVAALSGVMPVVQVPPKRRAASVEAYDLFVRGRSLAALTHRETQSSRPLLHKAIELDPGMADAFAWLAISHAFGYLTSGESVEDHRPLARAAAEKALALDPDNADAHLVLGYMRAYDGELEEGVATLERTLRLNPNHAHGWGMLSDLKVHQGKPEESVACASSAFRLDPHQAGDYYWLMGWGEYAARHYEAAVAALSYPAAYGSGRQRLLAASLAQLGRLDDARREAQAFMAEFPDFTVDRWSASQPFRYEADRQHFVDGYRMAGLP